MTDEEIITLAGEYVLGLLEGDALAQAQAMQARDATFQKAIQSWEWRLMEMAEEIPPVAPPERVWARIQTAISRENAVQSPPMAAKRATNPRWRWGFAAGGFAAALAAAVIFSVMLPRSGGRQVAAFVSADGGVFAIFKTPGSLILKPENITLPAGKIAELWLIAPNHKPQAAGLLDADHALVIRWPEAGVSGVLLAVSVEPPGGSPTDAPTGPVIAKGYITNS
jgi:anti-sigma-K factor RskA